MCRVRFLLTMEFPLGRREKVSKVSQRRRLFNSPNGTRSFGSPRMTEVHLYIGFVVEGSGARER